MLTKNGKAMLKINNDTSRSSSMTLINTSGTNVTAQDSNNHAVSQLFSRAELAVGTGSTVPSSSDYSITNEDAGLTTVTKTGTNDSATPSYTQDYIANFSKTYRNDTESDITINEVAIVTKPLDIYGNPQFEVVIARDVLSTPVTIAPGEAYTFGMYIG